MRLALAGVPLLVAAGLRLAFAGTPLFPTDDTYIAIHAARYLFSGVDPSYPEGAGLVGVTSPIHVFALWATMRVLPPLAAAELLTWCGAAAYLFGAATFICARKTRTSDRVMLMLVACLAGYTAQHLANGQETAWAMAAVVWCLHWIDDQSAQFNRCVAIAAVLPWLRPELMLWSAAVLWRSRRRERGLFLGAIGLVTASVGLYLLTNHAGSGTWLPNTVAAKRLFFAEFSRVDLDLAVGVYFLWRWLWAVGPAALGVGLAFMNPVFAIAGQVFVVMWLGVSINGPPVFEHNFFRYAEPFFVPAILAGFCARDSRVIRVLLAVAAAWCLVQIPARWDAYDDSVAVATHLQQDIATWLNDNAPAGSRVLVHDAGYLSEATKFQLVDLVGLKTPSSVQWHRQFTGPSNGARRGEAVRAIACQAAPQFYVAHSIWERAFGVTKALSESGWSVVPVIRRAIEIPTGTLEFTLYRVTVPEGCPPRVSEPR